MRLIPQLVNASRHSTRDAEFHDVALRRIMLRHITGPVFRLLSPISTLYRHIYNMRSGSDAVIIILGARGELALRN